jgi:FkbM family methyltransferase
MASGTSSSTPFGLGDENLKTPFYKPSDKNLGTGSFVENFNAENSFEGELDIQVGDDAVAKAHIDSVAVIKMDIEGYENPALRGLQRTLKIELSTSRARGRCANISEM